MANRHGLSSISQVCIVVRDIDKAVRNFETILGVGPFERHILDSSKIPGMTYRGKPANYSIRTALADFGPVTLELIQPVSGESLYSEFLEKHGEGLHHLGITVEDYKGASGDLTKHGFTSITGSPLPGKDRDGRYDYFDTDSKLGFLLELLDVPEELILPEGSSE